jgi:hypothetical protein
VLEIRQEDSASGLPPLAGFGPP